MKASLIVQAGASSNSIGAHGHPLLEDGNMSFPRGEYRLDIKGGPKEASMTVDHSIAHAPFIQRLLRAGSAGYACIVSSPTSFHRVTHRSADCAHTVDWDRHAMGEPPLFTPLVYCRREVAATLDIHRDGVHPVWHGVPVHLREGSRLAVGPVFDLRSSLTRMLRIRLNEQLSGPRGDRIRVEYAKDSSCLVAEVGAGLHRFLKRTGPSDLTRNNILTTIVTARLAHLREHHADETSVENDRTLLALANYVRDNTASGKSWLDEDFAPEEAATEIFPHKLPVEGKPE